MDTASHARSEGEMICPQTGIICPGYGCTPAYNCRTMPAAYFSSTIATGWQYPKCKTVYAPSVTQCGCDTGTGDEQ